MVATIDAAKLKEYVVSNQSTLLAFLQSRLPGGKKKGGNWICGNVKGEPGDSLSVPLTGKNAGKFNDFNTNDNGDIFSLVATQDGLDVKSDFKKIVEIVASEVGFVDFVSKPSTYKPKPKPTPSLSSIVAQLTNKAYAAPGENNYLVSKGIESRPGLIEIAASDYNRITKRKASNPVLLIPMHDIQGIVHSYQPIEYSVDDQSKLTTEKKHLKGASATGLFCAIPSMPTLDDEILYLAEGYATASSIYEVLGFTSVCCFGKTNLKNVAIALQTKLPGVKIVLCADVDASDYVKELATELKCEYCIPQIDNPKGDFNDLAKENKHLALKCLSKTINPTQDNPTQDNPTQDNPTQDNPTQDNPISVLDTTLKYIRLDLLQHIDDNSLISRLSRALHQATLIPESTIFMVGMGVFSSVATRAYVIDYAHKESIPISLYICAEQPSGAAKTRVMNAFTRPFFETHKAIREMQQKKLEELARQVSAATDKKQKATLKAELEEMKGKASPLLFVSNSTAEALENSLHGTGGFFSCVSSEQGLFNSIFGLSYTNEKNQPNRDIILHGYDNGFYGGLRISRKAYYGQVTGGVALFAQNGSIQTVLGASNETGLAERFLLLAEPHALGVRDHFRDNFVSQDIYDDYDSISHRIAEGIAYPIDKDKLIHLSISPNGWGLINSYRNRIEPELADGKRFSHGALRGQAAKIDMTIMKIAANLHLLTGSKDLEIDRATMVSAINIANDLLESAVTIMDVKHITGKSAACQAIVETLTNKGRPLTEREIIQTVHNRQPFKSHTGNKSDFIRAAIQELVSENTLTQERKSYSIT